MIRGSRTSAKSQPREAVHATQIPLLIELLGKPTNLGSKVRLGAFPFKTLRFVETIDLQFMQGEEVMGVDCLLTPGRLHEHNDVLGVNLRFEPYQVLVYEFPQ